MAVIVTPELTGKPGRVAPNISDELNGAQNESAEDEIEESNSKTEKKYDSKIIE